MQGSPIAADDVRRHLQHVLASASFEGSGRASTLLAFLVERTLRGEGDRLKEYTIATEALGKDESFDPRIDPIVRTEISRLRSRLDRYYATDGRTERVLITLPKGSYVPQFQIRGIEPTGVGPVRDAAPAETSRSFGPVVWFVLGAAATAGAVFVWLANRSVNSAPPQNSEVRVEIVTPPTTEPTSLAISPDGRKLAYSANVDGRFRLWVRSLDAVTARPLEATDGARYPFWSPDGKSLGFFVADRVKRVDVETGAQQTLFDRAAYGLGGAWSPQQFILFNTAPAGSLVRVPAMGGAPTKAIPIVPPTNAQSRPQLMPDGRHVIHLAFGPNPAIYVGELNGPLGRKLLDGDAAAYLPSRHLLFVRQGTLFAQPFDPDRLELAGTPIVIANQIVFSPASRSSALSASAVGAFVYRAGQSSVRQQLVWFDRSGRELGAVPGSEIIGRSVSMFLSPDGRQVAFDDTGSGTMDLWLLDVARGVRTRFTSDPAEDMQPLWSPDGHRIVFQSNRKGTFDLWVKSTIATETEQLLLANAGRPLVPYDWSKDGRFILYGQTGEWSIWALPMFGDRKPFPVVQSPADESDAQFSPDARWIAYMSGITGRREIFVQRFPTPGRRWRVSVEGGAQPRWRGDGKELFFLAPDNRLMSVPVRLSREGDAADIGAPVPLFAARLSGLNHGPTIWNYVASSDGQRFLMDSPAEVTSPITLVLNWKPQP